VTNELDWQTEIMLTQMVRDINWSLINGTYQLPADNTTARKTRGLLAAITTNVVSVAGTGTTGAAAAATDIITATGTAWSPTTRSGSTRSVPRWASTPRRSTTSARRTSRRTPSRCR
jgi:hypothetical protein